MLVEMEELNACLLKDLESTGQEVDGIKHMNSLRLEEGKSEKNEPPAAATDAVFSSDAANNYYNNYLMKDLESRGLERDGRKLFMSLGEGKSEKNEPTAAATDAVFSSTVANNYYQAIKYYKMKVESNTNKDNDDLPIKEKSSNTSNDCLPIKKKSSNTSKDNDGLPIKNKSCKGLKGDDSVDNSTIKSEEKSGGKSKNKSWKGLKGDISVDNTTIKSDGHSVGKSINSAGGKSVTSLQDIMAYVAKKGKEPAEVAEYLKNVDTSTANKAESRRIKKLLAEAEEKDKFYMDIVKFLMKAEEAKRKEEDDEAASFIRQKTKTRAKSAERTPKEDNKWEMDKYLVEDAMKRGGKTPREIVEERKRQELVEQAIEQEMDEYLVKDVKKKRGGFFSKKAKEAKRKEDKTALLKCLDNVIEESVKETHTTTELAEPLEIEEDKKVPSEREMNEQFIKDAMKQGAKTPAEIALHLLKIEEERKTQELVEQALKVCKSPKEIADYLLKATNENQREDEAVKEQESSKELVSDAPKQEVIRPGVAENSLTKSGKDKGSQARPKRSSILKRSFDPPVESLECHLPDDGEMSTTSTVTNHLKSIRSIGSAMSSECSIMTEIVKIDEDMDNSPRAVSQNKEIKSPTRTVSFAEGTKETSECKYEKQDSSKMAATDETSKNVFSAKKDVKEGQLDVSQSPINNPDDSPCSLGVKLISEESNEESQEITLDVFYAGYIKESHSTSDDSSVRDVVEEDDKEGQKNSNCVGEVDEGEDSINEAGEGEEDDREGQKDGSFIGEVEKGEDSINEAGEGEEEGIEGQKDGSFIGEDEKGEQSISEVEEGGEKGEEEDKEGQKNNSNCTGEVERGKDSISEVEECEVVYDESDSKSDEQDEAAKRADPLNSKLNGILTFKKKSLPKKVLNRKASKNSSKKIAKHEAKSFDSSGATQSCSSNKSIPLEKTSVKKKSLPKKVLNRKASKNSSKKIAKHEAKSSDSSGATQSCSSNESIRLEKTSVKKKSLPKKVLNRKASKNASKKIAKHKAKSSDSSGATQSCSSNESIPVEKKTVKKKIVEFNLEDGPDRPITTISIPEKDPAIYDEVTLPSVLRKKPKPKKFKAEPLEEWLSDMSILDDDDDRTGVYSEYSAATTQYTLDPYAVMDEDQEGCTCLANEVKDYTAEIGLIACEVLDYCSAKARKASTLLGFDSEALSKGIKATQAEVTDVERKKKEKKTIVDDDDTDNIEICLAKPRQNDSKQKKPRFSRFGLRNSSRREI